MISRFIGFALLGLASLAILFAILIVAGVTAFGLAMVRADAFAILVTLYWFGGAPLVVLCAWLIAKRGAAS